jgi:hypothetical protein
MKKAIFTLFLAICFTAGYSQLYNNGGTITVEQGATLVVEGDYTSTNNGTVEIDGDVELKGDLINTSGSIHQNSLGKLIFNGGSAQVISGTNSTTFYCAVEVDNSLGVSITGADQVLDSVLILTSGSVTLNGNDLTMSNEGITGASTSQYIVTNGAGELKSVVGATDVTFPVGNSTYNPVVLNNIGTSDTYGVVASDVLPAKWTPADHAVAVAWAVSEAAAGNSDLTVKPYWADANEQTSFDNTDCAVGLTTDNGTNFTWGTNGAAAGSSPSWNQTGSGFTDVGEFVVGDYFNSGIDLDLKLFLAGPYNGATMNTGLTVPPTDPYGISPTTFSIPANTVDWIQVDLLDGTTPDAGSPIKSYAFFLRNDGEVLSTDGAADVKITGVTKASYNIAVYHRNHLGACTGAAVDLSAASPQFDFSNPASSFYGTNGLRNISGVMALWGGDANGDGTVIYQGTGNDPTSISTEVLTAGGGSWTYVVTNGYSNNDINMDGQVIYQGTDNDPTFISNTVLGHPGNSGSWTFTGATAQLP